MGLNKVRLGSLISPVDERNSLGIKKIFGININKEFMPTAANTDGLDESNYKVVRKDRFVFSGMQTGRDRCIRISMYMGDNPIIVSPAYITFEITATDSVLPTYFFMTFISNERDRLGWLYSDGSIRSNLDWDRFCDIEIELPPVHIQQKYVNVYNAMLANQRSYERGLENLKLLCDAYIEDLRRKMLCEKIGKYIAERNENNENNDISLFQGVNVDHLFTEPKRVAEDSKNGKIVRTGQFAFNKVMKAHNTKLPIALREGPDCIVSNSYQVFEVINQEKLLPKYLLLWLNRAETQRYAGFIAFGTTRDIFTLEDMGEISIPIPNLQVQQNIVNIYEAYSIRASIAEKLKAQIKDICPILIKVLSKRAERQRRRNSWPDFRISTAVTASRTMNPPLFHF